MGNILCVCESLHYQKGNLKNSQSFQDHDIQNLLINRTSLTLISQDFYKFMKKNRIGCIFNIQDSHLEFPDKMFRNYVGDSVLKECKDYIKLHEDLCLNKVMHTKGGKTNSDHIIHGCYVKDSNGDNDADNLRRLISDTLQYANNNLKSHSIIFNLQQLKANCSKTCSSVILACQNFINEFSPYFLKTIFFVGSEESSFEIYSKALIKISNMIEKEEAYFSDYDQEEQSGLDKSSPYHKKIVNLTERTTSKKSNQNSQNEQKRQQSPIKKSQMKEIQTTEQQYNSQQNKSGIRSNLSKQNLEANIYTTEEIKTYIDIDVQQNVNINNNNNNNHGNSYSEIRLDRVNSSKMQDSKIQQKKELIIYQKPFEQALFEEEQQLQKLKNRKNSSNNLNRTRHMKQEFLQTNITQPKEDDDTSEKNHSYGEIHMEDSFSLDVQSDQITALINHHGNFQIEDSLFNTKLNPQQSQENQQEYSYSNHLSHKFMNSHQNF